MRALAPVSVVLVSALAAEMFSMERVTEGIHKDGVGRVLLGKALPRDLIPKHPFERYIGGYHGDAQPHDGFQLDAPPVTVYLDRGPFQRASRTRFVDPSEAKGLASKAVRDLRAGAKVRMIRVESPEVKTAAGVGVGSDLKALRSAYPDLRVSPGPPTFGQDECVATTRAYPQVYFHFRDCKAAEEGEGVVRILLFKE